MKDVTLRFINDLRAAGLRISVSESMDAMQAVAAVGIERELLREAFAASLVKEEEDRPLFDEAFARFFSAPERRRKAKHHEQTRSGEGRRTTTNGTQTRPQEQPPEQRRTGERPVQEKPEQANEQAQEQRQTGSTEQQKARQKAGERDPTLNTQHLAPNFKTIRRALLEKPFKAFDSRDVEVSKELVEELARRLRGHLSRRYKHSKRGRLDFRRTIRASISHGGVPIETRLRHRRPGEPDLVALCDLSGSVAVVSDCLLAFSPRRLSISARYAPLPMLTVR